jgi:hypothetical protein
MFMFSSCSHVHVFIVRHLYVQLRCCRAFRTFASAQLSMSRRGTGAPNTLQLADVSSVQQNFLQIQVAVNRLLASVASLDEKKAEREAVNVERVEALEAANQAMARRLALLEEQADGAARSNAAAFANISAAAEQDRGVQVEQMDGVLSQLADLKAAQGDTQAKQRQTASTLDDLGALVAQLNADYKLTVARLTDADAMLGARLSKAEDNVAALQGDGAALGSRLNDAVRAAGETQLRTSAVEATAARLAELHDDMGQRVTALDQEHSEVADVVEGHTEALGNLNRLLAQAMARADADAERISAVDAAVGRVEQNVTAQVQQQTQAAEAARNDGMLSNRLDRLAASTAKSLCALEALVHDASAKAEAGQLAQQQHKPSGGATGSRGGRVVDAGPLIQRHGCLSCDFTTAADASDRRAPNATGRFFSRPTPGALDKPRAVEGLSVGPRAAPGKQAGRRPQSAVRRVKQQDEIEAFDISPYATLAD